MWDPPSTAAPGFLGPGVGGGWGLYWGEGSMAHLGAACQTELVFSVTSIKSLWTYSHPTAQQMAWPHTCLVLPHRLEPGSCVTSGATEPRPWGFPSSGGCGCPGHSAPPSWPWIHLQHHLCTFQSEDPPKHPSPPHRRCGPGWVTLSCWKSVCTGTLSCACSVPSRASPRTLSSVGCMSPTEPS